jgi:hypothetical protein
MAANLFRHHWGAAGTRIILIESSGIGIIGVGEGSTPQLKNFFDTLEIAEQEWMPRCNATYKTGIEFVGWSDRPGFERYFHPFATDVDSRTVPQFVFNTRARRSGVDVPAHPDSFFLPTALARKRLAPIASDNFPFDVSYGYHFDAHLVGGYLRELAVARGVEHADARIADVELAENGDVVALITDDGRRFEAELFVDASGFRSVIMEQALGEPYLSFAENLFNDSAVTAPTPVAFGGPDCCTRAFAGTAGWIWQIPLTNRTGNGYVYSSRYLDREAAAAELRDHLGLPADAEVRHLNMRVGRVERSWVRNCLSIGLAQGFIEPLEATALHIVAVTVAAFIRDVDTLGCTPKAHASFNREIMRRYEAIRDYIVCHYRAARRSDTDYWRDATSHDRLSDSLQALMTCWSTAGDLVKEVAQQGVPSGFSAASWHCMLAGYGNFPPRERLKAPAPAGQYADMAAIERFISACAQNFPSHNHALGLLQEAA